MPRANEVSGCPPTKRNISPYQFMSKISDDFFCHFPNFTKIFPVISANYLHKILTTFFSHFSRFQKPPSLDAPRVDARGRRTTAPPSATGNDIHKTQTKVRSKSCSSSGRQCWHFPPGF